MPIKKIKKRLNPVVRLHRNFLVLAAVAMKVERCVVALYFVLVVLFADGQSKPF